MVQEYHILEMNRIGNRLGFDDAILVKVVSAEQKDEYYGLINLAPDPETQEQIGQLENWLVFKNYTGKLNWLYQKKLQCENSNYWKIDLNDFICRPTSITNRRTGDGILRPVYQVVMVNDNMDAVEAKELGIQYSGRTGVQKRLDELHLELVGKDDLKYYLLTSLEELEKEPFNPKCDSRLVNSFGDNYAKRWGAYAIPYNINEALGGMYQVDRIILCLNENGENNMSVVRVDIENFGIYNYMTRQIFKFGH